MLAWPFHYLGTWARGGLSLLACSLRCWVPGLRGRLHMAGVGSRHALRMAGQQPSAQESFPCAGGDDGGALWITLAASFLVLTQGATVAVRLGV